MSVGTRPIITMKGQVVKIEFWKVATGKAIDIKEISAMLGVKKEMAYLHSRKKNFPLSCFTLNREKYWNTKEVKSWIENYRKQKC